ncbi:hypothetical protein RHSIM_Rhsim06G0121300 [Rhododendron simsii]|uniref:Uncharacterized protein n=1 Tax=Rhododendron simsii TaxID=118357 RepID=A0A834H1T5_RHOSS|nr:hypothetical protein RHSIM_Rhsim06G0121300 [Rhododendron simsii]
MEALLPLSKEDRKWKRLRLISQWVVDKLWRQLSVGDCNYNFGLRLTKIKALEEEIVITITQRVTKAWLFSISTDAESATNRPDQNEEGMFADILLNFLMDECCEQVAGISRYNGFAYAAFGAAGNVLGEMSSTSAESGAWSLVTSPCKTLPSSQPLPSPPSPPPRCCSRKIYTVKGHHVLLSNLLEGLFPCQHIDRRLPGYFGLSFFFFFNSYLAIVPWTMYIQPGYFSKKLAGYERVRQKKMEQNLLEMKAAGINVPNSLFGNFGLNQSGSGKGNDKEKDIGRVVNGDPDYEPCDGEGRVASDSDNDDPSGPLTNQVKGTSPRKKKGCSSAQLLKKSQRTQEDGGSSRGATQAQQLPTLPIEQTDMFCSPHTVVGCVATPATPSTVSQNLRRKRGPTKLKTIAVDGGSRTEVEFDKNGQPIGDGSIKLSSFLGPLVREIVPYTLSDWRKLPTGMAEILWQSVKVRFNLHEDWHREMVFRRMNEDWRASKLTLVRKVRNALNEEERLKLQPDNIKSLQDWKDFVKEKTSEQFKVRSNKFKGMRQKQLELQHTMSRKGYARLTAELVIPLLFCSLSKIIVLHIYKL